MSTQEKDRIIEESIEWYTKNRTLYNKLCTKVHSILSELLDISGLKIHAIFSRAKEVESFVEKIKDIKYDDPKNQITDLAGIRIICYVESDVNKICNIVEENFDIDKPNSTDKSRLLGTDKVGYKSVHYVATLLKSRLKLPEYQKYADCKFEIQIRTILQHAWAEIEHDRNYKFSGELPEEIQRRFKLLAGTLEIVDREFDGIAKEIDNINQEISKGTKSGNLDFEINTTTLKQYLLTKFEILIPAKIQPNFPSNESETKILKELKDYGLNSLDDLNKIIPTNFIEHFKNNATHMANLMGLLRILMIVADWKKYFDKAYKSDWTVTSLDRRIEILNHYNVPLDLIKEKYKTTKRLITKKL